jgi:hypothetical protein
MSVEKLLLLKKMNLIVNIFIASSHQRIHYGPDISVCVKEYMSVRIEEK